MQDVNVILFTFYFLPDGVFRTCTKNIRSLTHEYLPVSFQLKILKQSPSLCVLTAVEVYAFNDKSLNFYKKVPNKVLNIHRIIEWFGLQGIYQGDKTLYINTVKVGLKWHIFASNNVIVAAVKHLFTSAGADLYEHSKQTLFHHGENAQLMVVAMLEKWCFVAELLILCFLYLL